MCESGFGFESGFKAFQAGLRFGFRPQKGESGFRGGFEFIWIRIRGVWIRIRIPIQDVRIRTSLTHTIEEEKLVKNIFKLSSLY